MSKKTILIIVLVILGTLILASGSYDGYRFWKHNKELKEQEKISAENDESIETDEEQISAESEQETETNDQTVNSGWLEYKNYSNFTKSDRPPPPAMGGFFILDIYRTVAIFSISTI